MRILVVDDSRVMREMISRTIAMAGLKDYTVEHAADGAEALALVRASPPDLIILDLNMPVLDGEEFLSAVRTEPGLRHLPVVVASSESSDVRVRRVRLMGAEFVRKPFKPEALVGALQKLLPAEGKA
jgi:two-component system chemotaxis response regulator CheY